MEHFGCFHDIGIHQLLINFLRKTLVFRILVHSADLILNATKLHIIDRFPKLWHKTRPKRAKRKRLTNNANKESGHGELSVAPLSALAPQLPAHRAGLSPTAPRGHNRLEAAVPARASAPRIAYINIIPSGLCNRSLGPLPHRLFSLRTQSRLC